MTLTVGHSVPVPIHGLLRQYPVPALHPEYYDQVMVMLSNASRQNQIYAVVNVQELMDCTAAAEGENCPESKVYHFNTNVVFDRKGAVIDRSPALTPDLGYFETDFGVRFGHFICFDLMFQVPAVQVVQKLNLTDIVFSTMWFSEIPYLTAVQIQEAYAHTQNINFLAAGANNVGVGSAGSGIYSGRVGALVSVMPGVDTTRLLVQKVPKTPGRVDWPYSGPAYDPPKTVDKLFFLKDLNITDHVTRVLVPGYQEFELSQNEVSCLFRIRLTRNDEEAPLYRAVVKDGINTYARRSVGVVACAVVACENGDVTSCPYRDKSHHNSFLFDEIEIEMNTYKHRYNDTLQCANVVYFPSTFQRNKFPLNPSNFSFVEKYQDGDAKENGGKERITMKLAAPQMDLVTFGVWGRIYDRDVDHNAQVTDEDRQQYTQIENVIYTGEKNKTKGD
ncbi:Vanin-like protein 2 [Eumeta japonica]|uniref:Vanin-like protein 2 n=1 Tax=Eumeta variegata TaxID=151549 RepID=A0A4C1W1M4_EUMVA|nr:Vanin-like protein 2 [Eumeta japonica]